MPLPRMSKQCHATAKSTQQRCQNPAAYGCKTCRVHGALRFVRRGQAHGGYKHGLRTQAAQKAYRESAERLDEIERLAKALWMLE